jgi:transcriptional regulator with XRE-family HTH domain
VKAFTLEPMTRGYSTPCARELGHEMRLRRQERRLSATDLSRVLGWSLSKVSRAELGMYRLSEVEVVHYLAACGTPHEELYEILELKHDEERNLGYWLRPMLRSLVYHESTATRSTSFDANVVPGLLQTEDYASALIRSANVSDEVFASRLQARMDRQAVLDRRDPAAFTFFIYEHALHLPVGDTSIIHEQLLHLVFSTARPHITIRVVPASAWSGSLSAFRLLDYAKEHRPLVYLDHLVGSLFLDDENFVAAYRDLVPRLDDIALSEGQSREVLVTLASEYDRARGELDAHLEEEQL